MEDTKRAFLANSRVEEARAILAQIDTPRAQINERSALCLLALADITPETAWQDARQPLRGITEMMDWFRDEYGKNYAPNTRETVRRQTMHPFVQLGLAIENPDRADRPINSPKWCYQLTDRAYHLLRAYGSDDWEPARQEYELAQTKLRRETIDEIIAKFCPRFTPGGQIVYIGDAGEKFLVNETEMMREMGIELDPHGKMPDLVVYYQEKAWLILIEAVTSHGPVNPKRHVELKQLFRGSTKGLVFVTAFRTRREMNKYLSEIAWETEVWVADNPDHLIHFNGERFLGPYET